MSPEELAKLHPNLFHLADAGSEPGIERHGMLSAAALVDLFDVDPEKQAALLASRRPLPVHLTHPTHGLAILNDNKPLSEVKLAKCLDGDLSVADWLRMLNSRVFFWADAKRLITLKDAALNKGRRKIIYRVRTLEIAEAYQDWIELSPINSGATIHVPARRGRSTFTPLSARSHEDWRKLRGMRDRIAEVVFTQSIPDFRKYVIDVESVMGGA